MSKVSDVHAALIAKIETLLPGHVRLSNPYKPEENPNITLNKGVGLKIGSGVNTDNAQGCQTFIRREFTIVITRKYFALETDGQSKATTEKDILEDAILIQKEIESDQTVGGTSCSAHFQSDSGIEYVMGDTDKYLKTEITIEVLYFEIL